MMRRASVRRLINIAADITPRGRGVALGESIDLKSSHAPVMKRLQAAVC